MSENLLPTMSDREIAFQLYEVIGIESLTERSQFAHLDKNAFNDVLRTASALARDHFQTHNRLSDSLEPQLVDGKVITPPQLKEALKQFVNAGFMSAHNAEDEGGLQLPWCVLQACFSYFYAANVGTAAYPFLTIAAANLIKAFGSEEQKTRFMRPMFAGRYFGTMCLSEPHAGSGLGEITTRAVRQADGTYRIVGSKMWISGGDHDLAETIVHMVLARVEGAPLGTRGISLFIVSRDIPGENGELVRNDVAVAGLNHKLGQRGTVNTFLKFGEGGHCVAYLVGEENQGLGHMFHMMNEARVGVGLSSASLGMAGFLYSRAYAAERRQGKRNGSTPPPRINEYPDVKRMLLSQKAAVEGALGLCLFAAWLVDERETAVTEEARLSAARFLDFLTPIVKSWPAKHCLEANKDAIQILGGYGYSREYPVEQIYRDNRLNEIHEGTTGIQAIDFLNRKLAIEDGAGLRELLDRISSDVAIAAAVPELAALAERLQNAASSVARTAAALENKRRTERADRFIENASLFLDMAGHLVIGWIWLRQAISAASARLGDVGADRAFYDGKLLSCRYFLGYELPKIDYLETVVSTCHHLVADADPDSI
ncbi:MAG: acyl-CoA dehydrogenase [Mesorhizobium sp.]|uniref:acyl-CoA dehydrogenase n=1 Tax=Mesorhizobium sp. TaxID=1871066 RepID=UPI000FE90BF5|nr:acyl-CoA dehydrogenase [Mesorhizobium sp.]RWI54736.1 MAG: acyl-CoA dehydrogenase [Mesorhizobium sp.]